MTLGGDVDFQQIAKKTPGFVGADLSSLTKEAAVVAINRIFTRLRAVSPPPPSSSPMHAPPSTAAAVHSSSTVLTVGEPHETLGNGIGSGAAGGGAVAVAPAPGTTSKGSPPPAAVANEGNTGAGEGGVTDGCGCSPINNKASSPSIPPTVQPGSRKTEVAGAGAQGAEAVGGFLAGPLSAAQLAPLSVTMEDFLMAVKKVRCEMCDALVAHDFLGVLGCCSPLTTKVEHIFVQILIAVWNGRERPHV